MPRQEHRSILANDDAGAGKRGASMKLRQTVKQWAPVGSPLWYSYFFVKRSIQGTWDPSLRDVRWHVVHENILLEPYKSIYIPIPKVACSTVKNICAQLLGMEVPSHDVA